MRRQNRLQLSKWKKTKRSQELLGKTPTLLHWLLSLVIVLQLPSHIFDHVKSVMNHANYSVKRNCEHSTHSLSKNMSEVK